MGHNLAVLPGMDISFDQPIRDNVLDSISQIDGQVVIKIFGDAAHPSRAADPVRRFHQRQRTE